MHPTLRWMPPCSFRATVAEAFEQELAGRAVALLGLPPTTDPVVVVRSARTSAPHPLGLVSSVVGGRAVWAHATVVPPATVARVVDEVEELAATRAHHPPGWRPQVDVLHDEHVEVTLVVVECAAAEPAAALRGYAEELFLATARAALADDLARLVPTPRPTGPNVDRTTGG
jgi:hypothetical protein